MSYRGDRLRDRATTIRAGLGPFLARPRTAVEAADALASLADELAGLDADIEAVHDALGAALKAKPKKEPAPA